MSSAKTLSPYTKKKYGLYRPLPIPSDPWESVSMDFMTQLPEWNGMDVIFIVIDWFSKLVQMAPIENDHDHFQLNKVVLDMWIGHHKMP